MKKKEKSVYTWVRHNVVGKDGIITKKSVSLLKGYTDKGSNMTWILYCFVPPRAATHVCRGGSINRNAIHDRVPINTLSHPFA